MTHNDASKQTKSKQKEYMYTHYTYVKHRIQGHKCSNINAQVNLLTE